MQPDLRNRKARDQEAYELLGEVWFWFRRGSTRQVHHPRRTRPRGTTVVANWRAAQLLRQIPLNVNAVDPDGRSDGEVPPLAPPGVVFGTGPGGIGTARTPDQGQDLVHTGYTRRSQTSNDGQLST